MTKIGKNLNVTLFGESHGVAVGAVVEGLPAGVKLDLDFILGLVQKRAPGHDKTSTTRQEDDTPVFLSGVKDGVTTGAPLAVVVYSQDKNSQNYSNIAHMPRPGHSDLAAYLKYHGYNDVRGGGHFSARVTAPLVVAGGLALQILKQKGIEIGAHILKVKDVLDTPFDPVAVDKTQLNALYALDFPVMNTEVEAKMRATIADAKLHQNSVGGVVECAIVGLPAGVGAPHFNGLDSAIGQMMFGLPAVKALEFGAGFDAVEAFGTENNDQLFYQNGTIVAKTNHAGGVLGGITYGAPVVFKVGFKPTPSVAAPQNTVDTNTKQNTQLSVTGRHDPSVVLRAVPVVIAATALAVLSVMEDEL